MTVIYIRHGNDEDKDPYYTNDPGLKKSQSRDVVRFTKKLIDKHGVPDAIYISPMHRSLETTATMLSVLPGYRNVGVSRNLSRYFTSTELKQGVHTIRPETRKLNPPLYEGREKFHKRLRDHYETIKGKGWYSHSPDQPLIWCITHALVMKHLSKHLHRQIPEHLEFLEYFVA